MHSPFAPPPLRAALALLFSLSLVGAAACGDDLDPPEDDGDDGDDDGADDGAPDGIAIEGLDGPVDVYFDEAGILHASCVSDHDCFAVEGYFHAAHRFVQMDIRRRFARGKIAALAGSAAISFDITQRRMMTTREGRPLEEKLYEEADERTRAALDAYAKGVNAWLGDLQAERNGAALPDEYFFPVINRDAVFDDWEPLDSVACILPLVDQLTNFVDSDIFAGDIYSKLDPTTADELFSLVPPSDSAILPAAEGARRVRDRAAGRALRERMVRSRSLFGSALRQYPDAKLSKSDIGSNNWIVAPSQTTGGALLANDPHLSLAHPAIWYLVHLDARSAGEGGTLHVAGASFAGLPGVLLGQNEDIAWGATTTYFDSADVYVETLTADRSAVVFDGKEVPIIDLDFEFAVAGGEPVIETFRWVPHHGPIIEESTKELEALSVRWTGHDADTDINFFLALASSTSVEEARSALENVTTAGQNFVVVDRGGNIGWFPYNRLPTRPWASLAVPSWMPVPGDGSAEWGPPIPYADLPQAVNPAAGFLATANNDMTGALQDGDPTNDDQGFIQAYLDEGYRHQRIVERLAERSDHDLASMQSIQADDFSLLGELLRDPIVGLAGDPADADAQAVLDALVGWTDFECPTGLESSAPDSAVDADTAASARGCAAFHVVWARLRDLAFSDELAAAGVTSPAQRSALIFILTDAGFNQAYWDDVTTTDVVESREEIVEQAFIEAGAFLRDAAGEPADWVWGRIHTVTLRADLFSQFVSDFNYPNSGLPFANDGGLFTVDVANPRNETGGAFEQPNGPSMRFACLADEPGVSCTIELPGGQRHDRASDYYNSMLDDWLANRPVDIGFDMATVAADAVETLQVDPL